MILDFFMGGCTDAHEIFQLAPLGNPVFPGILEMLTFLSTRKFASSILRGGKHLKKQIRCFHVTHEKQSVCERCFNVTHEKQSVCGRQMFNVRIGESSV